MPISNRHLSKFACSLLLLGPILLAVAGEAQLPQSTPTAITTQNSTGELPYSTTIGSSAEHVDLATGNLIIDIPFISIPGRHMAFDFGIKFDARFWVSQTHGSPAYVWMAEHRNWLAPNVLGWTPEQGYMTKTHTKRTCLTGEELQVPGDDGPYISQYRWFGGTYDGAAILTDRHGSKHATNAFLESSGECDYLPDGQYIVGNMSAPSISMDGYWTVNSGSFAGLLVAPDGSRFTSSITSPVPPATGGTNDLVGVWGTYFYDLYAETDVHGNTQLNASGGVDSIGRQPLSQVVTDTSITYTTTDSNGQPQNYVVALEQIPIATNFNLTLGQEFVHEAVCNTSNNCVAKAVQSVTLPNRKHYAFQYDSYGYVTHIDLPDGGTVDYQWTVIGTDPQVAYRAVTQRRVFDGVHTATWDLSYTFSGATAQTTVLASSDASNVRSYSVYTFPTQMQLGSAAYYASQGGTLLRRFDMSYDSSYQVSSDSPGLLSSVSTTLPGGKVSKREFTYDVLAYKAYDPGVCGTGTMNDTGDMLCQEQANAGAFFAPTPTFTSHGNVATIREYDWGQGAPGVLMRQTVRTYLHDQNPAYFSYPNPTPFSQHNYFVNDNASLIRNIVNKVAKETVYDGTAVCSGSGTPNWSTVGVDPPSACAANKLAEVSYTYDNGTPDTYGYKGDLTTATTTVMRSGVANQYITTQYVYDGYGNLTSVTDPRGNPTTVSYSDAWAGAQPTACSPPQNSYAYPTLITNAAGHQSHTTYYPCSGSKQSFTDPNNATAQFSYDLMGRLIDTYLPDGGHSQTLYNDSDNTVEARTYLTGSAFVQKFDIMDGLGRTTQTQLTDPQGTDFVDTTYDGLGRVNSVSNPYRSGGATSAGSTSYQYDALGRKVLQTNPDNTSASWTYADNVTTSTDEAGNSWSRTTDALGHLTNVLEPGALTTTYAYYPLGDLKCVDQWGTSGSGSPCSSAKPRAFTYDSLSRLLTSANPETGSICYGQWSGSSCVGGYDANGNLLYKTDARGVSFSYSYDQLDRLTGKYSSDGTVADTYHYDQTNMGPNQIGRLSFPEQYGVAGNGFYYDAVGRVVQTTYAAPGSGGWQAGVSASYDLAGNMTSIGYPDGRIVDQIFDGAGRLAKVSNRAGSTPAFDFVYGSMPLPNPGDTTTGGIQYTAAGAAQSFVLGNGVGQFNRYNSRLQPCHTMVSTPVLGGTVSALLTGTGPGNLLDRQSSYSNSPSGSCGLEAGNNGNIHSITDNLQVGNGQSFSYDPLNRLSTASRSDGAYNHTYNYDSFGNMLLQDNLATPSSVAWKIEQSTNRLLRSRDGGVTWGDNVYDSAGNLQSVSDGIGPTVTYQYNGLNQLYAVNNGATASYTYNGLDERVFKSTTTGWTDYVYLNGQPMAEQTSDGTWTDYIYANGQKIAKVDSAMVRAHLSGNRTDPAQLGNVWDVYVLPLPSQPYQVQPGDKLAFKYYQNNANGGLSIGFTDGSNSDWYCGADQNGDCVKVESRSNQWVDRVVDLGAFAAGKTIGYIFLLDDQGSPAGAFDVMAADMSIVSANGAATPILGRMQRDQQVGPVSACNSVNSNNWPVSCAIESVSGTTLAGDTAQTTSYYLDDHLGTTQMELSAGGWPVWEGQFTPFGQEIVGGATTNTIGQQPADGTSMRYKFTGKERDAESGLDYFGARYYASSMGRWTSPDWADKPEAVPYSSLDNPQSLNLYGYVNNNPLSKVDPDGHDPCDCIPFGGWLRPSQAAQISNDISDSFSNGWNTFKFAVKTATIVGTVGFSTLFHATANPDTPAPAATGDEAGKKGQPPQLQAGKDAHSNEEVRPGEKAEVATADGKGRMDRYDAEKAHIREIKPDNARGRRAGKKQLDRYKATQEKATEKPHTTELTLYPPK